MQDLFIVVPLAACLLAACAVVWLVARPKIAEVRGESSQQTRGMLKPWDIDPDHQDIHVPAHRPTPRPGSTIAKLDLEKIREEARTSPPTGYPRCEAPSHRRQKEFGVATQHPAPRHAR